MELMVMSGLGLALGLVLGYWSAMPRVLRLEKELRWQTAKAQALELDLGRVQEKNSKKAKAMVRALVKEREQEN